MGLLRRGGLVLAAVVLPLMTLGAGAAGAAVSISAPTSANLGSAPIGTTSISAQLGTVTVTASGLVAPSFTATVSATVFVTGGGGPTETISKSSLLYWSGPATAAAGIAGNGTPGQPTAASAVDLTVSRVAFSGSGLALAISASWNPTLVINIPGTAVVGTYTGTITHSVA